MGVFDIKRMVKSVNLAIFVNDMIKIAISDDHKVITQSLDAMLQQSGGFEVIDHASNIAECEAMLEQNSDIDVLLLDIGMPDGNSLDYIETWKDRYPEVRILVLSTYAEAAVINRALSCGADGYVLKSSDKNELFEGIRVVMNGEQFVCQDAAAILQAHPQMDVVQLTPREREVLKLIVEGYSIKMIADRLCLGFETVHSYYKYLKLKLGVPNTAALVRVAMEQKLV
ncbi:MAG: response regulator transcription factor [Prevotellaceae bacterium]|nr:response regulator transcription factor [Candidatus Minthosoma caballi]